MNSCEQEKRAIQNSANVRESIVRCLDLAVRLPENTLYEEVKQDRKTITG